MNSFKIASQDIKYKELIKECAKTKLPVQIDTGNATLADIETAVEWIKSQNNEKIIINQKKSAILTNILRVESCAKDCIV